ncbi:MAG: hypothetical protein AAF039_13060 [Bacteroidota bacterium]
MNIKTTRLAIFTFLFLACQPSQEEQLARDYYHALNTSDFVRIAQLQFDSVRIKEGSYHTAYSVKEYMNWLQWDSVFLPKYEILDLKTNGDTVELTVSKVCQRIQFLNGGPMVSKESILLKAGKMHELEIQEFISFDNEGWDARREQLVNWIDEHHPELNDFIYDQTLQGGINYRKALELYQNK